MAAQILPDFDNSYARFPDRLFAHQLPTPVADPGLIRVNQELARRLGIDADWLASAEGVQVLAGNSTFDGATPIASAYAGHQFGSWNPQLGDGRAILLAEVIAGDGVRYDIQLKGAGRTPWSRGGDGRSPLGPVLREYIVSEAMATLGVPTTRALAAVTTGEHVMRESALPGAILTRVARSHIRIGTFQFFAARQDREALQLLAEHVIHRHYPQAAEAANPLAALLHAVVHAQACLIAHWQLLGFIHGVMNTDNMLLSGETIDYGPCAFMDHFNPEMVFSSIDQGGRYAYCNQPGIAQWNLACFAQTLLPLLDEREEQAVEIAQAAIDNFQQLFLQAHNTGMQGKLGLTETQPEDEELVRDLLELMAKEKLDFTLTFRRLAELANPGVGETASIATLFEFPGSFTPWLERWRARLQSDKGQGQASMYAANPVFIPRNHLVEEVIQAANNDGNLQPFHALVDILSQPSRYDPALERYATPPTTTQIVHQTFCGT